VCGFRKDVRAHATSRSNNTQERAMKVIKCNSVSEGLSSALTRIITDGVLEDSRNGQVLVFNTPVTTVYTDPRNRVLFSARRDANPFFHFMEAMWMLCGRNDLAFPQRFNSRFGEYSDDGQTIWGAYGWRWRKFLGYDQLDVIVGELMRNPNSRRCVLSMWNAVDDVVVEGSRSSVDASASDLHIGMRGGKDVPCNTHVYFAIREGKLDMTVCNRSNDLWWGCYGANAVHFSFLQEYMAARLKVPMGTYYQVSNNLHLYTDVVLKEFTFVGRSEQLNELADEIDRTDAYGIDAGYGINANRFTMGDDVPVDFIMGDVRRALSFDGLDNPHGWVSRFGYSVVRPMLLAHNAWRDKSKTLHQRYNTALVYARTIGMWDWNKACCEWLDRRVAGKLNEEKTNG
jgi:Thymidylate synthase